MSFDIEKGFGAVSVVSPEATYDPTKSKVQALATVTEVDAHEPFFPFANSAEREEFDATDLDTLRRAKGFPWSGVIGILGSFTMIAISAVILSVINGHALESWHKHIPRPAGLLSAVLSLTTICLHMALSEGASIAWWYRSTQATTTVRDLHTLWSHGSSISSVLLDGYQDLKSRTIRVYKICAKKPIEEQPTQAEYGRRFTYLGLATLFIAAIPANGIILQNAVDVVLVTMNVPGNLTLPTMSEKTLDSVGGSGTLNNASNTLMQWSQVLGLAAELGIASGTSQVNLNTFHTGCPDMCNATLPGLGFLYEIEESTEYIDLNPQRYENGTLLPNQKIVTEGVRILETSVQWDEAYPMNIILKTFWKGQGAEGCAGNFDKTVHNLTIATVDWPVSIKTNITIPTPDGFANISVMDVDYTQDRLRTNMNISADFDDADEDAQFDSGRGRQTYLGGIADLLGSLYNSYIFIQWNETSQSYEYLVMGSYGQQQFASYTWYDDEIGCKGAFLGLRTYNTVQYYAQEQNHTEDWIENVGRQFFASVQQTTFLINGYMALAMNKAFFNGNHIPTVSVPGLLGYQLNIYKVAWHWYFISLAITVCIALSVTPTFWGFWKFERRVTMSPVDTARSLRAPILTDADNKTHTKDLLDQVGTRNIHKDLEVSGIDSAPSTP